MPFEDRLEIGLHFPSGNLDPYGKRQRHAGFYRIDIAADYFNFPVVDSVHFNACYELERRGDVAAELGVRILLSYPFALECRAVRYGNGHLRYLYFTAAHLKRALDHRFMRHVRHDMFVCAYARRQYLRYVGIGNDREAIVQRPRGGRVFFQIDLAERKHKREYPVFVIPQIRLVITRLYAAERQRRAARETKGINKRGYVGAERHEARFPSKLHALLGKLRRELPASRGAGHKHVQVFLLQFAHYLHRNFVCRRCAGNRREAGGGPVDKLDAPLAHNHVAGGAEPYTVNRVRPDSIFAHLYDLAREQRRYSRVKRVAQIRQPYIRRRPLRQQFLCAPKHPSKVAKVFHFFAGKRIYYRHVICRIGKSHLCGFSHFFYRFIQFRLGARNPFYRAINRTGAYQLRHRAPSCPSYPSICALPRG